MSTVLAGYYDVSVYSSVLAAEQACEMGGGGVVYFPPGTWNVPTTIAVGSYGPTPVPVQWRGCGPSSIITGSSAAAAPSVISTASGTNDFTVSDLQFLGNNTPPGSSSNASPVIDINGGSFIKILNCYFTLNQGRTIYFNGVADGEVAGCTFFTVGYNGNANYTTDAVIVDAGLAVSSYDIRIHHNHFDTCLFGAVRINSTAYSCDVSHNYITNAHGTGIYFDAMHSVRVAFNAITTVKKVGTLPCVGIQADHTVSFCIIGNDVSKSDGDGIAVTNGWANAVIIGNNAYDNKQSGGSSVGNSGIHLNSDTGSLTNNGLVLIGNNCFDDQPTPTQEYGIRIDSTLTPVPQAFSSAVVGNATYNNASTVFGIYAPSGGTPPIAVMSDDSNTIIGNTGNPGIGWFERMHTTAPVTVSGASSQPLQNCPIAAGSMRQRCGIKITAGGTSGISGGDVITLGFSVTSSTTAASFTTPNLGTGSSGNWMLVATIMNDQNGTSSQAVTATLFFGPGTGAGAVAGVVENTLTSDTTALQTVWLKGHPTGSHTITCDYMTVERC
jgi:hypothetical protein